MASLATSYVKQEPADINTYTSYEIPVDDDEDFYSEVKQEEVEDSSTLFIPEAPIHQNFAITLSDLAYRPAPPSHPALSTQSSAPAAASTTNLSSFSINSSLPPLPGLFGYPGAQSKRLLDSDGTMPPTECFLSSLSDRPFQHRLVCGHLVATEVRQKCGTKCKLQQQSNTKPVNKGVIECPHPDCLKIRKSMGICLRPRQQHKNQQSKKAGVKVVPEGFQLSTEIDFTALNMGLRTEADVNNKRRAEQPESTKRVKLDPQGTSNVTAIQIHDPEEEAAIALLSQQLSKASNPVSDQKKPHSVAKLAPTIKRSVRSGVSKPIKPLPQRRSARKQLHQNMSSAMFSMPEDHHTTLITQEPGLVIDREACDEIGDSLARSTRDLQHDAEDDEMNANDLTNAALAASNINLHCVCTQPKDHSMLECSKCRQLFHAVCIGKGNSHPEDYEQDREQTMAEDVLFWHDSEKPFTCRDCDENATRSFRIAGKKRLVVVLRGRFYLNGESHRPDLSEGKRQRMKLARTAEEKSRIQKKYSILYENETRLGWNDHICADCGVHVTNDMTRYHCDNCLEYDLCARCMRKQGKEHSCSDAAFTLFRGQDAIMGNTEMDYDTAGRRLRKKAVGAMRTLANVTKPR